MFTHIVLMMVNLVQMDMIYLTPLIQALLLLSFYFTTIFFRRYESV